MTLALRRARRRGRRSRCSSCCATAISRPTTSPCGTRPPIEPRGWTRRGRLSEGDAAVWAEGGGRAAQHARNRAALRAVHGRGRCRRGRCVLQGSGDPRRRGDGAEPRLAADLRCRRGARRAALDASPVGPPDPGCRPRDRRPGSSRGATVLLRISGSGSTSGIELADSVLGPSLTEIKGHGHFELLSSRARRSGYGSRLIVVKRIKNRDRQVGGRPAGGSRASRCLTSLGPLLMLNRPPVPSSGPLVGRTTPGSRRRGRTSRDVLGGAGRSST